MPVMSKRNWSIAPAVRMCVTMALFRCRAGAVPSTPRVTVKTFPFTPTTTIISSSTFTRNCGMEGKREALVTVNTVEIGDIPPTWLMVV